MHYDYYWFLEKYQFNELKNFQDTDLFESIDDDIQEDQTFLVVNRQVAYLQRSAYEFAKSCDIELCDDTVEFASDTKNQKKNSSLRTKKRKILKKPGRLQWPIERSLYWLSSYFGSRKKEDGSVGFHYGLDMAASKGTPVKAAGLGVVIEATYTRGYGKTVVIAHADGCYQTRYAHLDKIAVKRGQRVISGQEIASVGNTGFVRGENGGQNAHHLHFEVKLRGKHIDPLRVLPA